MNKKMEEFIKNPGLLLLSLGHRGAFNWMSDEAYLKMAYKVKMGKELHLNPPVTFNEKAQWIKLHDRKPIYTQMVDKAEAKEYVKAKIGEKYIIPTLGLYNSFDEIDFEKLPQKFVLKCTHDSGGLVIVKDKSKLDKEKTKKKIEACLKNNYFWGMREWPYKNVKPRIIAEQYLDAFDNESEVVEYKLFCFHGVVKMILVCRGEAHSAQGRTNDFYDRDFNLLPFTSAFATSEYPISKPAEYDELISIAEELSRDIPLLRVDTYIFEGKVYFGELTFFHESGYCHFNPDEWDKKLGNWLTLPTAID